MGERGNQEEQQRASERTLLAIFDSSLDAMLLADDRGRYVEANPAACALFGLTRNELLGRHVYEFAAEDYETDAVWQTFVADGQMRGRFFLKRPDGAVRLLDFSAVAHILPGLHLSILRDVTEHQRAAEELTAQLRASEQRYRRIIESTSEGVWVVDAEKRTTFVNQPMADMLGVPRELLLDGAESPSGDAPPCVESAKALLHATAGGSHEHELRRCDGSPLWVRATTNPLVDERGNVKGSLSLVTDVSERMEAEQTRCRLAAIVESSDDAIISRDAQGLIRSWNRGAERLLRYSAQEVIGQPLSMLFPDERTAELLCAGARPRTGPGDDQACVAARRKDGSRVEVAIRTSRLEDSDSKCHGVSVIARDMSELRRAAAALKHTEAQLRQAQKMEAVGSLAGGLAHDFNNLLSIILSYTKLILDGLAPSSHLRADLQQVLAAGTRATDLTRQLLAFSRQQVLQPTVLDLNVVVLRLEKMLSRSLRDDIRLRVITAPGLGPVHADLGQLEQVIVNLVVNASDAMSHSGGALTIATANVRLDNAHASAFQAIAPGDYVTVSVSDTGVGMDPSIRERAFDPFFTTKGPAKGTGLGLSTAYGIVQQSGGHIAVDSTPGVGSTFTVYLPKTDRSPQTPPEPLETTGSLRGDETILLVEDEAQVRAIAGAILRSCGYHVLEAQNADEALSIGRHHTERIHLLLTDVVMPDISGRALAERLTALRPELRVLYMSGYTEDTVLHHGVLTLGVGFLQKPITPDALRLKVREVLAARRT